VPINLALNHLYRVVDHETYEAIRTSSWIAEHFAPRDERTTTRPDWTYTGVYLYGRHTYVEFFQDDGAQGPEGSTGMAFAVPERGDTAALVSAWRETLGAARTALVDRPTPEGGVPWFRLASAEPDRRDGLHLWSMEYDPRFLAEWQPTLTPHRGIGPAAVLDRYAATVSNRTRDAFLLEDIVAIELELADSAAAFLRAHLAPVLDVEDGQAGFHAALGRTTVHVRAVPVPRGLMTVRCSVQQPTSARTLRFGSSELTLDGRGAVWRF
jgi:hypothetical protein